jgi:hypothetical protein
MKFISVSLALLLSACGGSNRRSSDPKGTPHGASICEEIAMLCHEHDKASAVAHECHVLGHSKESTEAACLAKRPECLQACSSPEGAPDVAEPTSKEPTATDAASGAVPAAHDHATHEH